ncbi:MAG: LLM class flavin-dependent oxidoreductase [Chloroflexi bacterium]|nr:LLM class flavin-dependent oxidoreductase [Chloroflexota bacterium]
MEVGFFTMPLHPPGALAADTMDADLEQIVTLDKLGYTEAWVGEHFTSAWENIPAPDLFLAKAIGLTKNIKLGTGVTCMPNHSPFMIAHRIAVLDHLARGRFYWGVGSGGWPGDFKVTGIDDASGEHRAMSRDAVELVLKIWTDPKPGHYKSKYWDFNIPERDDEIGLFLHTTPYQKPHPPIGVAGVSRKSDTLVLAGERGWIPMSINIVPPSVVKTHWDQVEMGAKKVGKTPDRSIWRVAREVYIADSTKQARKEVLEGTLARDFRDYFLRTLTKYKLLDIFKNDPNMADSGVTIDYLIDNIFIVGSPDEVAEKLHDLYNEVGGFGTLLTMGHEWNPKEQWVQSVTRLKNEVMPKLKDLK